MESPKYCEIWPLDGFSGLHRPKSRSTTSGVLGGSRQTDQGSPRCVFCQWHPPEFPYYIANSDVAVFRQNSSARLGVIIHDNRGEAISALSMPISLSNSVAVLEALACRRALLFAKEIGLRQVVFEGDSAMVIQAITHGNSELAEYGHIVEDIRILAADFNFIQFSHVKRNCNVVADALAKKAKDSLSLVVWLEQVLEDIAPLLLFDIP